MMSYCIHTMPCFRFSWFSNLPGRIQPTTSCPARSEPRTVGIWGCDGTRDYTGLGMDMIRMAYGYDKDMIRI